MSIKAGSGALGSNYMAQTYVSGNPILAQEYLESFDDTMYLTDTGISKTIKSFLEAVSLLDLWEKTLSFIKSYTDTLGISDLASKFTSIVRIAESILMSDVGSVVQVFLKYFTDTISLLEDFASDLDRFFSRLFTEQIYLQDTYDRILDKLMSFSDTLGLTDLASKVLPAIEWVDNLNITDTALRAITVAKEDIVSLTDSIGNFLSRSYSEGIDLSDTLSSIRQLFREFLDNIGLTDTVTKAVTIVGSTLVSISDSIKRRVNGMLILWEKTKNLISDWTTREKTTEEYSTIEKEVTDEWTARSVDDGSYTQVSKPDDDWTKLKDENK